MLPPVASAALTPYVVGFLPDGLDIGARSWYIVLARPVALRFVRGRSERNVHAQPKPPPDSPGGGFLMLGPPSSRAGKSALYRAPAALIYLIQSRQNAPNATKPMYGPHEPLRCPLRPAPSGRTSAHVLGRNKIAVLCRLGRCIHLPRHDTTRSGRSCQALFRPGLLRRRFPLAVSSLSAIA